MTAWKQDGTATHTKPACKTYSFQKNILNFFKTFLYVLIGFLLNDLDSFAHDEPVFII